MNNQMVEKEEVKAEPIVTDSKLRIVKIPRQDFTLNRMNVKPTIDQHVVDGLREIFAKLSSNDRVNPYQIKEGLRQVDFHKDQPQLYKLIEDLCLQFDINGNEISFQDFLDSLNEHLGDNSSRLGVNKIFSILMDPKIKEITPDTLHQAIVEIGDKLSSEDVKYILEIISEPSKDINVTADEFYYIMTKKPADVDLLTQVTKSTK